MSDKSLERMRTDRERSRQISMVVTDMDGSFLNGKGQVSERNIQAVKSLQKAGIKFAVCTGRRYRDAMDVLEKNQIRCGMVAMNGAAIYDEEGVVQKEYILGAGQVEEILDKAEPWREQLVIQLVARDQIYVIAREDVLQSFFAGHIMIGEERKKEMEELLETYGRVTREEIREKQLKFYKVEIMCGDEELIRRIKKPLKEVAGISVAASFATNWEITHEKATKGAGLTDFGKALGYGLHQIMALGDGDNDRTMLSLPLGWSVSMGNGTESIRETAQVITGTNEEDGFAQAAEALLAARAGV